MGLKDLSPRNWGRKEITTRRDEGDPFSLLQREMNTVFDEFARDFGLSPWRNPFSALGEKAQATWMPRVDVNETDKEVRVAVELPGLDEKNVNVSLSDNALTISGEKKAEKEEKGKNYYRSERSYGAFHRSILLPTAIDQTKAEASFKKGVLTVTLPKDLKGHRNTKKIDVKAG